MPKEAQRNVTNKPGHAGLQLTRRQVLKGAAGALAAAAMGGVVLGQQPPQDTTKVPGALTNAGGGPSSFETLARAPVGRPSTSFTPLQDLDGMITPSGLHFERHHNGVPQIDPTRYKLLVHGMVARPMVFTLDDLK
ncbi:MAG TPA: twin-arginine translocation signal domain-containing protein, partial [Dehalococcoidia bacterium]|nr:twin-arginine translocation signal domain-containing protein [Dehalococcoidia bacterium]